MFNLYNYEILLAEGYKLPQELGVRFTPDRRPMRSRTARSLGIARREKERRLLSALKNFGCCLLRNGATIAAFAAFSPVAQSVQSSGSVQPYLGAGTDANPGGVAPLADAERAAAAHSSTKARREEIGIAVLIVMVISC